MKHKHYSLLFSLILLSVMISSSILSAGAVSSGEDLPPGDGQDTPPLIEEINPYFSVEQYTLEDGTAISAHIINGPPKPPEGYEAERAASLIPLTAAANTLSNFPSYSWVFGCSAVSGAMIAAYYDRNGFSNMYAGPTDSGVMPLTDTSWPTWTDGAEEEYPNNPLVASHNGVDGRTTRGSIDNYWVSYESTTQDPYLTNGWTQHTWETAIGDYMKTSQSAFDNVDSSTTFYNFTTSNAQLTCETMETTINGNWTISERDGTYGRKLFYEARGYTVTDCYNQLTDNQVTGGFSFEDFQAEIDAGHPVMINVEGHTMVGYGYTDDEEILIRDTWDNDTSQTYTMDWGGSYQGMDLLSVSVVNLEEPFSILSPTQSKPAFAGSNTNPRKIIVEVNKPAAGLAKDKFTVLIGGSNANIILYYEGSDKYVFEVMPPPVANNGMYNLTVNAAVEGKTESASEENAISYADAANVDVELVIDRSGSMSGTPIASAKQAASQFVDFMQFGDMVGVVSFSSSVTTNFPLTTINPLTSSPPIFSDDMEGGSGNWTAQSPWGLTTADSYSPTHAWTDSPDGNYSYSTNVSLQIKNPVYVDPSLASPVVSFWQKYAIETNYDKGYVEASTDGGSTWVQLGDRITGTNTTWHQVERDLAPYTGQQVLIRFRLVSDSSYNRDGWYIDDVTIGESSSDSKILAKNAISTITASGTTSIGGGLQRAQEQLTTLGAANHPWAIVLLTDGLENTSPYVKNVLPDIVTSKTVVHTVGLGSSVNQAQLLDIATQTGGTYNFAPTPEELAGIYNTISGTVSNQQTLHASTGILESGATDTKQVVIDSTVSDATFSISWSDSSSVIDLTLKKPNGDMITPSSADSDDHIVFVSGSTYQYYRITTPALTSGVWEMQINGGSLASSDINKESTSDVIRAETYTARVTGNTSLTALFSLDRDAYLTYEPVKLVVALSDTQPILNASITASVYAPSGFTQALNELEWIEINGDTMPDPAALAALEARAAEGRVILQLYDDGWHGDGAANDGVYANTYHGATEPGTYSFSISAEGTSTLGEAFLRLADLSTYIAENPDPSPGETIFLPLVIK